MPYIGYPVSSFPGHLVEHVYLSIQFPYTGSHRTPEGIALGVPQVQVSNPGPVHKVGTTGYGGVPVVELRRSAVVLRSRVERHQRIIHIISIPVTDDGWILGERIILDH